MVDFSPNVLTARFIRRADFEGGVPQLRVEKDFFYSPFTDFQPMIMRSIHFHMMLKIAEDNWFAGAQDMQIEALWREILAPFSRSEYKHVVWLPDYAETVHLGVPDYLKVKAFLNL